MPEYGKYDVTVRLGGESYLYNLWERSLADALSKLAELVRMHGIEAEAGLTAPRVTIDVLHPE